MNESMLESLKTIAASDVQFIWQTGGYYYAGIQETLKLEGKPANLYVTDFIAKMEEAYAAADLVISRAGASSISELCLLGKPVILVPSPNVAEDHQTKNALALVDKDAALYVKDAEAVDKLVPLALQAVKAWPRCHNISGNWLLRMLPTALRRKFAVWLKLIGKGKSKEWKSKILNPYISLE